MKLTKTELRLAAAQGNAFNQGQKLLQEGAVKIAFQNEASVRGTVRERYDHSVSVQQMHTGQLRSSCTCYSYTVPCAHVVALLLAMMEEDERKAQPVEVHATWENYLKELPGAREERIAVQAQSYEFQFVLQIYPNLWTLRPQRVYIKKSGEFGQRAKIRMNLATTFSMPEATHAENKAINHLLQRNKVEDRRAFYSYYAYDSLEQFEFKFGEEVGYILDLLVESRLYVEEGETLKRVHIAPGTGKLKFQLDGPFAEGESEHFRFYPQLRVHDAPAPLGEGFALLAARPFWLLQENKIIRVESSLPAAYVLPFMRSGYELRVPSAQLNAFLQGLSPHLKHGLALDLPATFTYQVARDLTGRRLYLQESEGALRVELRFLYGEAIEVNGMGTGTISVTNTNQPNELWRVERDYAVEAETHLALQGAGLLLDQSREFYVTHGEAVAWVFEQLPKLAASGFEIFGEEKLKNHRVNRAAPNVKLAVSSGIDWFDLNVEIDFDGVMLSLAELKSAIRHQSSYLKLADGSLARMPEEWEKRFRHFFNFSHERNGKHQIASAHALLIDTLFDDVNEKRYDDEFRVRLEKLNDFKGLAEVPVPKNFLGTLRPYQQFGLNWMGFLREYGFHGCLADDMGLGKTVQALACLLYEKEQQNGAATNGRAVTKKKRKGANSPNEPRPRTSLIVAPLSVVFNWEKECSRFAPDLKLLTHHGLERKRGAEHFDDFDLVLTTYATMRNDIEVLKDHVFNYVILDESQNIKNPVSQTAKAACILQSRHRLVLTGTPVENNTLELWSQFAFLNPGMLGSLNSFRALFAMPIEKYGDEESAALLKKMISPFLLRRTKEEVARELPEKSEQVFYCPMPASQKRLYEQVRDQCRAELMNLISTSGMNDARFKVLQGLTRLRQIACHPALLPNGKSHESGKFEALLELLREIVAEGHKVLVFSQFVSMLKIVANALRHEGLFFETLTGATRNREECVRRFQEDASVKVFLISLKAGGLGLNLTAADYVILYDPWWNPAAERQATDRAHRIGQDKKVFVYKMITQGSVEEKILELQRKKENLVSQLISTDAGVFKHLTAEDIRGLFS